MQEKEFYQFLLERYANGVATDEEIRELFAELESKRDDADWEEIIEQVMLQTAQDEQYDETRWGTMIQSILASKQDQAPVRRIGVKRWWIAASVLVVASAIGYLFLFPGKENNKTATVSEPMERIVPGSQGAILTLADKSQVLLDTIRDGAVLALQGGANARVVNGNLIYDTNGAEVTYNTIATPKGRQYRVTLSDGTNVWLNSGSSIRYPTAFAGKDRVVRITGEAYLEVAKNPKQPFRVDLDNNTSIQVLGTSFNVNAYDDEPSIRATLLNGSVSVNRSGDLQKLTPGQQAEVSGNEKIKVLTADVDQVVAWKNGLFDFNNRNVKSVLREIARWYDLDIVYESEPSDGEIVGKMQRSLALTQVMETLNDLDIHYRIEGRKLIVSK